MTKCSHCEETKKELKKAIKELVKLQEILHNIKYLVDDYTSFVYEVYREGKLND